MAIRVVEFDEFVEALLGVGRAFLLVENLIWRWDCVGRSHFWPAKASVIVATAAVGDHGI